MTLNEHRLGPYEDDRGKEIAIKELLDKINELVREVNSLREELTDANVLPGE